MLSGLVASLSALKPAFCERQEAESVDFHKLPVKNRIGEIHCLRRLGTQDISDTENECHACLVAVAVSSPLCGFPGCVGNNALRFRQITNTEAAPLPHRRILRSVHKFFRHEFRCGGLRLHTFPLCRNLLQEGSREPPPELDQRHGL